MVIKGAPVWITGASSGIGLALSREFLRLGAQVLALDRDARGLAELKKEAELLKLPLETLQADVTAGEAFLETLEGAVKTHGVPAVFVNNAGIAKIGPFAELGLAAFEQVMAVNLRGVVWGTHFALKRMESAGRGLIINMSSTAGLLPTPQMTSYSASKFAVVGFTRALQAELEMTKSPVKLCLVCPGFIDTPIMRQPGVEFPSWMRWIVERPDGAARAIARQALAGKEFIVPDFCGKLMQGLYRWAPGWSVKGSQDLFARALRKP